MDNLDLVKRHLAESISTKQKLLSDHELLYRINRAAFLQISAISSGRKLMFAGNGGSAADSQHLAAEYVSKLQRDREPLPAMALTTDTSALTAIGNDYGFDQLFARQLKSLAQPGDVLVGISTSGNSKNIVNAFLQARTMGVGTIGFFGSTSGLCDKLTDISLNIPSQNTANIQEAHITIGHIICALVEKAVCFD